MPLSRRLARFNRQVTNHVTRPFAAVLPGFAVVVHRGRRTGRTYRTPVNAYRQGDEFVIVLPYTSHSDWVANVRAANACELVHKGRHVAADQPVLRQGDDATQRFPAFVRPVWRALHVDEALVVRRVA
jgi:deazaflavin-dependent oxidoreductase (nitroreductase family)